MRGLHRQMVAAAHSQDTGKRGMDAMKQEQAQKQKPEPRKQETAAAPTVNEKIARLWFPESQE